jgi:hypothetical protein
VRESAALLVLAACGSNPQFVGTESLGASDLRVVVARTSERREIVALPIDQAYRFELEPLDDVFARKDRLEIAIFGFTRTKLMQQIPGLADRALPEVIALLSPELGAPGVGLSLPPEPEAILTATIDDGANEEVAYAPLDWTAAQSQPELQFGFRLPGEIACPPVDEPMRVFNRARPDTVCIFTRNSSCEWTSGGCANLGAIFEPDLPNARIRESSDRRLLLPNGECAPTTPQLGETRAWSCNNEIIAAQEQVVSAEGAAWLPTDTTLFTSADFALPHRSALSTAGVLYAFDDFSEISLRRLSIASGVSYRNFETPLLDDLGQVTSNDGIEIAKDADFDGRVGVAPLQCFETLIFGRQDRAQLIDAKPAPDRIRLAAPGLGTAIATSSWQIVGDPGPDFIASPDAIEIRPPDIGTIERVSSDPSGRTVAVHGSATTLRLLRLDDRFPNELSYFACALPLVRPAELIGEVVAGENRFYGIGSNGVLAIDGEGNAAPIGASRNLTAAHRIDVVSGDDGTEHVVVWTSREVHVIDASAAVDMTLVPDGDVLAVFDGPRLVLRAGDHRIAIADVLRNEDRALPVPPFSESDPAPLEIAPGAVLEARGHTVIGYSAAGHVGMIDEATGLSSAVPSDGRITALFHAAGGSEIWAVVENGGADVTLLRFPLLP